MALRRFTYGDASGYPRQAAPTDSIELGGLAMSGDITMDNNKLTGLADGGASGEALVHGQANASLAGLAVVSNPLTMGNQQITGLASGTQGDHAVNRSQLDQAVINGGRLKELLLHDAQLENAMGVLGATVVHFAGQPQAGDTVSLTNGTLTRTYGAGSGGEEQYAIGASAKASMQNFADEINGDELSAWTAHYTENLSAISPGGVVVIVEKDNTGAPSKLYGSWAAQANLRYIDFTGQHEYTRKFADLISVPATVPAQGNFGIRRPIVDVLPGEIHNVEDTDTMYAWDSDTDQWHSMSGASSIPNATSASGGGVRGKITANSDLGLSITAGVLGLDLAGLNPALSFDANGDLQVDVDDDAGLVKNANGVALALADIDPALSFDGSGKLQADANAALGLSKGANGIGIKLATSNPALGFDGSGDLEARVVATGGIEKTAGGLQFKIDDTVDTLDVDGDGAKVVGLPSAFKIDGANVSANVNASNMSELVAGGPTTLHTHAGSDEATRVENELTAGENMTTGDPVIPSTTANTVLRGDAGDDDKYELLGVVKASKNSGETVEVISQGPAQVLSGATPKQRYYLGAGGGLSTSVPTGERWIVVVGFALDATTLFVQPRILQKRFA